MNLPNFKIPSLNELANNQTIQIVTAIISVILSLGLFGLFGVGSSSTNPAPPTVPTPPSTTQAPIVVPPVTPPPGDTDTPPEILYASETTVLGKVTTSNNTYPLNFRAHVICEKGGYVRFGAVPVTEFYFDLNTGRMYDNPFDILIPTHFRWGYGSYIDENGVELWNPARDQNNIQLRADGKTTVYKDLYVSGGLRNVEFKGAVVEVDYDHIHIEKVVLSKPCPTR